MTTLDEKMRRISGEGCLTKNQIVAKSAHPYKWDTMESGVENVYLLRNRHFEKYFGDRPAHWPNAWRTMDVIWDSVGMLWSENDDLYGSENSWGDMDTEDEPLLAQMDDSENNISRTCSVLSTEKQKLLKKRSQRICERVFEIREQAAWDYLVVYFDQCLVEPNPYSELCESKKEAAPRREEEAVMGGFFDGVCTISLRLPEGGAPPYLVVDNFATERSLSDEENQKVIRSMVEAAVQMGQKIAKDVEELQKESFWAKAFSDPLPLQPEKLPVVAIIIPNNEEDDAVASFWKDSIGFEDPTEEDILNITQKFEMPLLQDYEHLTMNTQKYEPPLQKKYSLENQAGSSALKVPLVIRHGKEAVKKEHSDQDMNVKEMNLQVQDLDVQKLNVLDLISQELNDQESNAQVSNVSVLNSPRE